MKFVFYTHSLVSDWGHGNAHFLRGIMRDLKRRGHDTLGLEPENSWSRQNLVDDKGEAPLAAFHETFPDLGSEIYNDSFDHEAALDAADVVVVHDWTEPALVERIGKARRNGGRFTLIFHDTHHRAFSTKSDVSGLKLQDYDLVLAFGETLRERYLQAGWGENVFTWHEAADDTIFRPMLEVEKTGDLIWIGNWADDERSGDMSKFLIKPALDLKLSATVRGVRYPDHALGELQAAGIAYGGWLANADAPDAFACHRMTVHIPRRPAVQNLPGIPAIRIFEALACGIPLICASWDDAEHLFRPGRDFLTVSNGAQMKKAMRAVLSDASLAEELIAAGLETITARHTCRHRVDELLTVLADHGTKDVRAALKTPEAAL